MNSAANKLAEIQLDEYGLLKHPEIWNREVAMVLAHDLGIAVLNAEHWRVINAMRLHYDRFGVAPAIHNICRANKKDEEWVHDLFATCLNLNSSVDRAIAR